REELRHVRRQNALADSEEEREKGRLRIDDGGKRVVRLQQEEGCHEGPREGDEQRSLAPQSICQEAADDPAQNSSSAQQHHQQTPLLLALFLKSDQALRPRGKPRKDGPDSDDHCPENGCANEERGEERRSEELSVSVGARRHGG